jgi:hypothetical protein
MAGFRREDPGRSWPSAKEIEAVSGLPPRARADYLVRRVVDRQQLFTLRNAEGYCLGGTRVDGRDVEVMPIWPAAEYAAACAKAAWSDAAPVAIPLDTFLARWTTGLARDGRLLSLFPTLTDEPVIESPARVADLLRAHASEFYGDDD